MSSRGISWYNLGVSVISSFIMDKKIRIAGNGFGRIGRAFFKLARKYPEFDIVAVNDLGDPENMVYLLKYDTAYGKADFDIHTEKEGETLYFVVEGERTKLVTG